MATLTFLFAGILSHLCGLSLNCAASSRNVTECYNTNQCWWFLEQNSTTLPSDWSGWAKEEKLELTMFARQVIAAFVTAYLCILSGNFMFPYDYCWRKLPYKNKVWIIAICLCIATQLLYFASSVRFTLIYHLPWYLMIIGCLWILPLLVSLELAKRKEIIVYRREQRRRRLAFGTKLGLNSPF